MAGGAGRLIALVGLSLLLSSAPNDAIAQVFIASQPKPDFTIGPLFVRANVGPKVGPIDVTVLFGVVPATAPGNDRPAQDLYLLWPGAVDGEPVEGAPDPELRRAAEARGFQVAREGRLPLAARAVYSGPQRPKPEPQAGGAPFVTFSREAGPLGQDEPIAVLIERTRGFLGRIISLRKRT